MKAYSSPFPSRLARRRRCFVHIGLHKTGSSAIQNYLYRNQDSLGSFAYLHCGQENSSVPVSLAFSTIPADYAWAKRWGLAREDIYGRRMHARDLLSQIFRHSVQPDFILSGEDISAFNEESLLDLRTWLSGWVDEIYVLAYVRSFSALANSRFQQLIRMNASMSWDTLIPEYKSQFEMFDRVFGRERVCLWHYESGCEVGGTTGIVGDFCQRLGMPVPKHHLPRVNEGVSLDALRLIYAYHTCFSGQALVPITNRVLSALASLQGTKSYLSAALIEAILSHRRGDIEWLESRIGVSLDAPTAVDPSGINQLEDLFAFDERSLSWLEERARSIGFEIPGGALSSDPDRIAHLMHGLLSTIEPESGIMKQA